MAVTTSDLDKIRTMVKSVLAKYLTIEDAYTQALYFTRKYHTLRRDTVGWKEMMIYGMMRWDPLVPNGASPYPLISSDWNS